MALAANVHARLLDIDASMSIIPAKRLLDMLDCGSPYESAVIQDPLIPRPRGRPRKAKRTLFKVTRTLTLTDLGGKNVA
jgi:hypothetical protein